MVFICHPEATCLSSPKDPGASRESYAVFAGEQVARLARLARFLKSYCDSNEGGKNGTKFGLFRSVGAVFRVSGSDFHRRLVFSSTCPRPKLLLPLCTTFDHILALSSLLSSRNLKVGLLLKCASGKARSLVANRKDHHNGLCLRFWFFRHTFAYFFSCIPRPTA